MYQEQRNNYGIRNFHNNEIIEIKRLRKHRQHIMRWNQEF